MRINNVGIKPAIKIGFKGVRTDRHAVAQLAKGEKPIIENNKQNIYSALNNLSQMHDDDNISFLLYVAENLAYGQGHNSAFKDILDKEHITPENRENTDWFQLLDDTIRQAISQSSDDSKEIFMDDYQRIFGEKKELTPEQAKIIELRKELTSKVLNALMPEESENIETVTNIRQNIDYFVASSEIPLKQKQQSLEKLIYFMSSDYKINPQLKDKKLQALDEILNDIVVKTPADKILKTKDIDQRQSGICAAISISRKAMAHEDKVKFIDLIMDELQDSKTMSVYDITELGTGKKVNIPKANINYNAALQRGYRIIDASAHNWMQNAHAAGNGTIQTEYYTAFEDDDYGIFDDSSWYTSDNDELHPEEKRLLRALIKEKEYIDSFYRTQKTIQTTQDTASEIRKHAFNNAAKAMGRLNSLFAEILPQNTPQENTALIKSLFKFYKDTNRENEANIAKKQTSDVKRDIITQYIINTAANITDAQKDEVKAKAESIMGMTEEYLSAEKQITSLTRFSTPRNKYILNKKLFNIAAAHRTAIERDVNLQDGVARFERLCGLPPRDIQISDYLKSLRSGLDSYALRQRFADENGSVPTKKQLEAELNADILKLETTIPKKLNDIAETLYDKDLTTSVLLMFKNVSTAIKDGDKDTLENAKMTMNIKGDKNKVISILNKWVDKLSNNPSQDDILEAVRMLGYDDRMHISTVFLQSFFNGISQGISEDQYQRLLQIFGGEEKLAAGIELQNQKFEKLHKEYNAILKRWNVPSAREQIIEKMEKQHDILSRKQLDALNKHFMLIQAGLKQNEKIKNNKEKTKANNSLFTFTEAENETFKAIEKKLSQMRKFSNMEYNAINDLLHDELEAHYANMGMLNGQFWVREEGSSGLYANEQIRIIEQMTGKPYHIETDITEAAKKIKEGNGSGILAMSVDDTDYAFHAQYSPAVTSETFINPKTGEKIVQDVIWTDNSWGDAEREYFWNGHDGFYHTDYSRGFGLKDGFILSDDGKIGLPVSSIHGAIGTATQDDGEKFGVFSDVILPGSPVDVYQKLYKMFNYILNIKEGETQFASLESMLAKGYKFSIDELEGLDDISEAKFQQIVERVEKEINSEADFDKLPETDELKMAFKQLAVYMSTNNPQLQDISIWATNDEELKEASDAIFAEHMDAIATILAKTGDVFDLIHSYSLNPMSELLKETEKKFGNKYNEQTMFKSIFDNKKAIKKYNGSLNNAEDIIINQLVTTAVNTMKSEEEAKYFIENATSIIKEAIDKNIKIKSFSSPVLSNSPLYSQLFNAVDKYLEPKTDEEMLQLIQELQMATNEQAKDFFDAFKPEDAGIREKKAYDYLLRYKAGNSSLHKALWEIICNKEIRNAKSYKDNDNSAEDLYRGLYVKLSEMDVQKYIKAFKAEAFKKYKVRQAFPDPVVVSDEEIYKTVKDMMQDLSEHVDGIYSSQNTINVLNNYKKLCDDYIYNPDFMALYMDFSIDEKTGKSLIRPKNKIEITEDNVQQFMDFLNSMNTLYGYTTKDASFKDISQIIEYLAETFNNNSVIDGDELCECFNAIAQIFEKLKETGITKAQFSKMKKAEFDTLNKKIGLMVNANIEPKYRDEGFKKIHEIIKMYKTDAPQDYIDDAIDNLAEFITKRHIVKNPTVLLKETVKLLMAGQKDSDLYHVLKHYLLSSLTIAQQTKIQYKLVQNQHEGISTKTKEILPLFSVTMTDGSSRPMNSESGMIYIMKQLENTGDNYATLNLLLKQSGLTEKALDAMINNFEIEKTNDLIDEKTKEIIEDISELDNLASIVDSYLKNDTVKHKTIKDSIESVIAYVKKQIKDYKEKPAVKQFVDYLESLQYTGTFENTQEEVMKGLTGNITYDALQSVADSINNCMKYIYETSNFIQENVKLIVSLKVPEDSASYAKRTEFLKKYDMVKQHIGDKIQEISETAQRSSFLSGERVPA